jgi:hypothetical protein
VSIDLQYVENLHAPFLRTVLFVTLKKQKKEQKICCASRPRES